ncbi:MAG: biopolymer transporter ExbD [Rickettsiales bacterium]|nr:biopolymer transporter ExbD [Rickettsiales bacterium]
MEIERNRRFHRQVNLTPLIDVVFLLIVFFMLSTSFVMSESMELILPSARKAQPTPVVPREEIMRFMVQPDGSITYREEFYSLKELDLMLQRILIDNPEQGILVLSSDQVSVQQLINVIDMINLAGGKRVQIDHFGKAGVGYDVQLEEGMPKELP